MTASNELYIFGRINNSYNISIRDLKTGVSFHIIYEKLGAQREAS